MGLNSWETDQSAVVVASLQGSRFQSEGMEQDRIVRTRKNLYTYDTKEIILSLNGERRVLQLNGIKFTNILKLV